MSKFKFQSSLWDFRKTGRLKITRIPRHSLRKKIVVLNSCLQRLPPSPRGHGRGRGQVPGSVQEWRETKVKYNLAASGVSLSEVR